VSAGEPLGYRDFLVIDEMRQFAMKPSTDDVIESIRRPLLTIIAELNGRERAYTEGAAIWASRVAELEADNSNLRIDVARRAGKGLDDAMRIAELEGAISTPDAVWANMLRGTIARPTALDHYEECKARVEELERALNPFNPDFTYESIPMKGRSQ
jgi:hypothetical protein